MSAEIQIHGLGFQGRVTLRLDEWVPPCADKLPEGLTNVQGYAKLSGSAKTMFAEMTEQSFLELVRTYIQQDEAGEAVRALLEIITTTASQGENMRDLGEALLTVAESAVENDEESRKNGGTQVDDTWDLMTDTGAEKVYELEHDTRLKTVLEVFPNGSRAVRFHERDK